MTNNILLSIKGLQLDPNQEENQIEVITAGEYYLKNGKHYILYDEVLEGKDGIVKNIIKISNSTLEITKRDISNVHMVFEVNKKNLSFYDTPFGSMLVGISTSDIMIDETDENINIKVEYGLEINNEHLADCIVHMNVKSKEAKDFTLT